MSNRREDGHWDSRLEMVISSHIKNLHVTLEHKKSIV